MYGEYFRKEMVVRIENGRNRCLEFALCPCLPDILKPKFFTATSEDELQRWMVMFEMEIQNANSTGNPAAVTTRRPSNTYIYFPDNRHPQLSHITTSHHVQVNQQQFGNPQYLGDINYEQGRDMPVNHQQCGNSQYLGDYEQGRVESRTLPSCVIGIQYPSQYYNDSRSRQYHFNFTTGIL
ncbi:unnamed protein product [Mytilus coruscus]|uniref:PH domain-containing protein n=1 Tax=Mytilus coruscus TaxID=42192 RepID=A0A6J8A0N4_MYTCO|nr:unnamed protein product [Mytilus coruscus]